MPSPLRILADLGAATTDTFWLPVLAWTVLALSADLALRAGRSPFRLGLAMRGALVALLPLSLMGPPLLAQWIPSARTGGTVREGLDATMALASSPPLPSGTPPDTVWTDVALGGATVLACASAVAAVCVLGGGLLWIVRYRRRLVPSGDEISADLLRCAETLGIRRPPQVALVAEAVSPYTLGCHRPVIVLPSDLNPSARVLAMAHEMVHVRESHFAWTVAEHFVRALFVWHPLVHRLGRALALDRERAADATVVQAFPDQAAEYGRMLHVLSARPTPRFALGASSSHLLSRLQAMNRTTPDHPRTARLAGVLLLVLPLVGSAAVHPDATTSWEPAPRAEQARPQVSAQPAPLAPETPRPEDPAAAVEPAPIDTAFTGRQPAASDTLSRYLAQRQIINRDGMLQVEVVLTDEATYEIAEAIADYYSDGTREGHLLIVGNGYRVERSTLRPDALPPAPAVQAPILPLRREMSDRELDRFAAALRAELQAVTQELSQLQSASSPQNHEARLRLSIRQEAIEQQYRSTIAAQEQRRIETLRESVREE